MVVIHHHNIDLDGEAMEAVLAALNRDPSNSRINTIFISTPPLYPHGNLHSLPNRDIKVNSWPRETRLLSTTNLSSIDDRRWQDTANGVGRSEGSDLRESALTGSNGGLALPEGDAAAWGVGGTAGAGADEPEVDAGCGGLSGFEGFGDLRRLAWV